MAYVVARRGRRYEIRESVHTPKGPRARSLVNFGVLTPRVLQVAASRATRPFDPDAVLARARLAGVPEAGAAGGGGGEGAGGYQSFVQASRALGRSWDANRRAAGAPDPGTALIELLGFSDVIARSRPARTREPLQFPVLAWLVAHRRPTGG
ncbi:MAG: hypothetical protein ACR2KC_02580 [Acidimicrobiales bacterium]